ncbi:MAG TPA: site-2 protease family protein [Geobacterales bacterium]|nr:site-2 protease family protein [Geobacterales bacterium]
MEEFLLKMLIILVPGIFAITCHEVSHGFVADLFGDPTARRMGRLTLNPLKHLSPLGTFFLIVAKIGWAKPVPVNFHNLRHPRRDMILVAAAGPVTNFTLAIFSGLLIQFLMPLVQHGASQTFLFFAEPILAMVVFFLFINLLLGFFNLTPIPPLDGGRVVVGLLPEALGRLYARIEPIGFILVIFIVFGTDIYGKIMWPLLGFGITLLSGPYSHEVIALLDRVMGLPSFMDILGRLFSR